MNFDKKMKNNHCIVSSAQKISSPILTCMALVLFAFVVVCVWIIETISRKLDICCHLSIGSAQHQADQERQAPTHDSSSPPPTQIYLSFLFNFSSSLNFLFQFFLWLYHYEFYVSGLQTLFEARYSIIKHHYVGWMYSGAKSRENVSHLLEKCERIQ